MVDDIEVDDEKEEGSRKRLRSVAQEGLFFFGFLNSLYLDMFG